MLSVNTNYSAMVALQNLNFTNTELEGVQNKISTGLKIGSARDNGAIYAIAEGQRSRVSSVAAVKDGIDRANSTIDVALAAGKSIGDILQKLKAKAVAAQADDLTTDQRAALQADFASMRAQIDTIANSAQFNGANLAVGSFNFNVLISDLGGSVAATTDGVQSAALATPLSASALNSAGSVRRRYRRRRPDHVRSDRVDQRWHLLDLGRTDDGGDDRRVRRGVNAASGARISASV